MTLPVTILFVFILAQISWDIQTRQVRDVLKSSIGSHAGLAAQYFPDQAKTIMEKTKAIATTALLDRTTMDFYTDMQKAFPAERVNITVTMRSQ
jgi:hypothetical protein